MRHGLHFNYDGEWSYDMGVTKINLSGGLFEDQIISSKSIIEEKIEGRKRPYFYGVEYDPLSFPLPIYFDDNLTADKIRQILRWLNQDTYKPLYMNNNPERVWYALPIDDVNIIHNGIRDGYLELNMRTNNPRTLTPYVSSIVYSFTNNSNGKIIEFENSGDFDCSPIVHIIKRGNGDLSIQNLSNDTGEFKFTGLNDEEVLYVDCEHKEIETNENLYRYDSFSKNYLVFTRGINRLRVVGNCDIWFETEFEVY